MRTLPPGYRLGTILNAAPFTGQSSGPRSVTLFRNAHLCRLVPYASNWFAHTLSGSIVARLSRQKGSSARYSDGISASPGAKPHRVHLPPEPVVGRRTD